MQNSFLFEVDLDVNMVEIAFTIILYQAADSGTTSLCYTHVHKIEYLGENIVLEKIKCSN